MEIQVQKGEVKPLLIHITTNYNSEGRVERESHFPKAASNHQPHS